MSTPEIVLEVMGTARSMRWLKEDPVEWDLVEKVIWAGTRASSPNNTQGWDFVVVTSAETKRKVQEAILARSSPPPDSGARAAAAAPLDPTQRRTLQGARNALMTMNEVPVLIFVCGSNTYPEGAPVLAWAYSAMYAAAQNMIVAARALGLGAAFTTFHQQAEAEDPPDSARTGRSLDRRNHASGLAGPTIRPRDAQTRLGCDSPRRVVSRPDPIVLPDIEGDSNGKHGPVDDRGNP